MEKVDTRGDTVAQERLVVFTKEIQGCLGLDICVLDEEATVTDLLAEIAPYSDEASIYKTHHPKRHGSCCGCTDNCCTTSLIVPDLSCIRGLTVEYGGDPRQVVEKVCDPDALQQGYVVFHSFPCQFLHEDQCTIYSIRPLICRLFLCTRLTEPFQDLIYAILGRGVCEVLALLPEWQDRLPGCVLPENLGGQRESEYRREFSLFYQDAVRRERVRRWPPGAYDRWKLREFCTDLNWAILTRRNF